MSGHSHSVNDVVDFPSSMPANDDNSNTLDGKYANEFASAADVKELQIKVGNIPVFN